MTYADLAFVPWNIILPQALGGPVPTVMSSLDGLLDPYPNVKAWHGRMVERDAFKKTWALRQKTMDAENIDPTKGLPPGMTLADAIEEAEREKHTKGEK
jgi:hypothetical protein